MSHHFAGTSEMFVRSIFKLTVLASSALLLSACMPTRVVKLDPLPATNSSIRIVDKRNAHEDRAYLSGGGNIYSCLYGITRVKESEVVPERLEYLRAAIGASAVAGTVGEVTVKRFDIYVNSQAELKQIASGFSAAPAQSFAAGAIQGAVREIATHNGTVIGCDGTETGEYWSDEYTDNGHPVLVYLEGEASGKPFNIRQITFANTKNIFEPENWSAHVRRGIDMTMDHLISELAPAATP